MPIKRILVLAISLLNISNAYAETHLLRVLDGDTVIIQEDSRNYHLRLLDIDAPELKQAYGKKAKRALIQLCQPKQSSATINVTIKVTLQGVDKYGRDLGHLFCNGEDVSMALVAQGMAWFNHPYSHRIDLQDLENHARENELGLWRQRNPSPPWQWRKQHPHIRH